MTNCTQYEITRLTCLSCLMNDSSPRLACLPSWRSRCRIQPDLAGCIRGTPTLTPLTLGWFSLVVKHMSARRHQSTSSSQTKSAHSRRCHLGHGWLPSSSVRPSLPSSTRSPHSLCWTSITMSYTTIYRSCCLRVAVLDRNRHLLTLTRNHRTSQTNHLRLVIFPS